MRFTESPIQGIWIIDTVPLEDSRGFFMRSFCKKELIEQGLDMEIVQINSSYNKKKGTIRGMHYQIYPCEEQKKVSCIQGSIYDVAIDLRRNSPTFLKWHAEILSANSHRMLYIPKGCAHGFQTLQDDCVVQYEVGEYYNPVFERAIRWNDPSINIKWPLPVTLMSEKDQKHADFIP
jgi:dTDP-4-dehydrorhamnose 3,5-epimerase